MHQESLHVRLLETWGLRIHGWVPDSDPELGPGPDLDPHLDLDADLDSDPDLDADHDIGLNPDSNSAFSPPRLPETWEQIPWRASGLQRPQPLLDPLTCEPVD